MEGLNPEGSKAERETPQACSSAEEAHATPSESSPVTELSGFTSKSASHRKAKNIVSTLNGIELRLLEQSASHLE